MTTSYELSLKLKEAGVEQSGEYYWVQFIDWQFNKATMETLETLSVELVRSNEPHIKAGTILCRALTLGEIVRELPDDEPNFEMSFFGGTFIAYLRNEHGILIDTYRRMESPEEAAGELLLQIKNTSNAK